MGVMNEIEETGCRVSVFYRKEHKKVTYSISYDGFPMFYEIRYLGEEDDVNLFENTSEYVVLDDISPELREKLFFADSVNLQDKIDEVLEILGPSEVFRISYDFGDGDMIVEHDRRTGKDVTTTYLPRKCGNGDMLYDSYMTTKNKKGQDE